MRTKTYEVGYGKTPVHSRWKKGCESPNPAGRKKMAKLKFKEYLDALWSEIHVVREGNKSVRRTSEDIIIQNLTLEIAKGDARAIRDLRDVIALRRPKGRARRIIIKVNGEDIKGLTKSRRGINGAPCPGGRKTNKALP